MADSDLTPGEIRRALEAITAGIDRLNDRFEGLRQELAQSNKELAELAAQLADHETRLTRLEKVVWGVASSVVVFVITSVVDFTILFKH